MNIETKPMNKKKHHPFTHRKRLEIQGFCGYTDKQLASFTIGIRFAYIFCAFLTVLGLILTSTPLLALSLIMAFLGAILPRHPFDYLYNSLVRHWLNKPAVPPRTSQSKFACGIATIWLASIIISFTIGQYIWGYILGGVLLSVATLVSTTDICIPSIIYNILFKVKIPNN